MKTLIHLLCISNCFAVQAQHDLINYNQDFNPQVLLTNPAIQPLPRFFIATSGYASAANTGFNYKNILQANNNVWTNEGANAAQNNIKSGEQFVGKLNNNNNVVTNASTDVMLGLRVRNNYFTAGVSEKASVRVSFPKSLFRYALDVAVADADNAINPPNEAQGNFQLNAWHYREHFIGISHKVDCNFFIGGRVKYIYGMENIHTKKLGVKLINTVANGYTEGAFDINMQSSGIILNPRTPQGRLMDSPVQEYENKTDNPLLYNRHNSGIGVDIGASYTIDNRLTVSASILDIGFVRWKSYTAQIKSQSTTAYYQVEDNNNTNIVIRNMRVDTFYNKNYTTSLNTRAYAGANYKLTKNTRANVLLYGEFYNTHFQPSASFSVVHTMWKIAQLQVNASYLNRSVAQLGVGLTVNLLPFQIYVMSDNAMAYSWYKSAKTAHLRAGINIILGYFKDCKNPCSEDYGTCGASKKYDIFNVSPSKKRNKVNSNMVKCPGMGW